MFSVLAVLIIEGHLPGEVLDMPQLNREFTYCGYAFTSALAFSFLFFCIIISLELLARASNYMYRKGRRHNEQLDKAMHRTKKLMDEFRFDDTTGADEHESICQLPTDFNSKFNYISESIRAEKYLKPKLPARRLSHQRTSVASMNPKQVNTCFQKHESSVHTLLMKRADINEEMVDMKEFDGGFQEYWAQHCEMWAVLSILCFYIGSATLLFAIIIFVWFQLFVSFMNLTAAIIAVTLIGLCVAIGVIWIVSIRRQKLEITTDGVDLMNSRGSTMTQRSTRSNYSVFRRSNSRQNSSMRRDFRPTDDVEMNGGMMLSFSMREEAISND